MVGVVMVLHLEVEPETDGRWLAEITDLPGVMAYGVTRPHAVARVQAVALRALADRMERQSGAGTAASELSAGMTAWGSAKARRV